MIIHQRISSKIDIIHHGSCKQTHTVDVKLQGCAYKADFRAHSSPLFKKLDLLKVTDIVIYIVFKLLCSCLNFRSFSYLVNLMITFFMLALFTNILLVILHQLSCCHFVVPLRQKCIRYQSPFTWHNLPSDIKLVDSSAAFKNLYEQYLINKY